MIELFFCHLIAKDCETVQRLDIIDSKQVRWEETYCSGGGTTCETEKFTSLEECKAKADKLLKFSPGKGQGNYVITNCKEDST